LIFKPAGHARKPGEEYRITEVLELAVNKCGWWMGNREFIWSDLICMIVAHMDSVVLIVCY